MEGLAPVLTHDKVARLVLKRHAENRVFIEKDEQMQEANSVGDFETVYEVQTNADAVLEEED